MVPGPKQDTGDPGFSREEAPRSQISGYHLINPSGNYFPMLSFLKLLIFSFFPIKVTFFQNTLNVLYAAWLLNLSSTF